MPRGRSLLQMTAIVGGVALLSSMAGVLVGLSMASPRNAGAAGGPRIPDVRVSKTILLPSTFQCLYTPPATPTPVAAPQPKVLIIPGPPDKNYRPACLVDSLELTTRPVAMSWVWRVGTDAAPPDHEVWHDGQPIDYASFVQSTFWVVWDQEQGKLELLGDPNLPTFPNGITIVYSAVLVPGA